jgi:hypothetical protein
MSPIIENINGFDLPPGTEPILQKMFANHSRVVIKDEFSGGLGGSRVIVVRPIRADGTAELPVVVKLAAVSLNEKEWRAYQDCVHSQLPHAAQAKGPPVTLPGSNWSGLCYPLLGGGGTFKVDRLRDYVQRRMVMADDARFALKRLLTAIGRILQFGQPHPEFRLRASYDRILPLNLLIRPTPLPPDAKPITIRPGALPRRSLQKGDPVRVEGFAIAKVDLIDRTITLNLPAGDWPDAYYLRLKPIEAAKPYQVKQIMDPVEGVVSQTRSQWLRNKVASILD